MTNSDRLIQLIASKLEPLHEMSELILLFGSLATGNLKISSDIDILIVSNQLNRVKITEHLEYFTENYGIGYDIIHFNSEEFKKNKSRLLVKDALEKGLILWENEKTV